MMDGCTAPANMRSNLASLSPFSDWQDVPVKQFKVGVITIGLASISHCDFKLRSMWRAFTKVKSTRKRTVLRRQNLEATSRYCSQVPDSLWVAILWFQHHLEELLEIFRGCQSIEEAPELRHFDTSSHQSIERRLKIIGKTSCFK